MSVDRRLRSSLRAYGDALQPDTLAALGMVTRRVQRRRRWVLVVRLAVAALAIVAVAVGMPWSVAHLREPVAVASPSVVPAVSGTYFLDVRGSSLARTEGMVGRWVVELTTDGAVQFVPPDSFVGSRVGTSYQLDGDQLRTNIFVNDMCGSTSSASAVGTYRWVSTPTTLRFAAVNESCKARHMFFTDQIWQKR